MKSIPSSQIRTNEWRQAHRNGKVNDVGGLPHAVLANFTLADSWGLNR